MPPLAVPPPSREPRSPEALLPYDAVRLFVDRAKASWPLFELTTENQADVAELVRRLDGVPLAIELAAVRVRSLSAAQILDRLGDRFCLLTQGDRAASPRQQSLRALLDWSHDLLGCRGAAAVAARLRVRRQLRRDRPRRRGGGRRPASPLVGRTGATSWSNEVDTRP